MKIFSKMLLLLALCVTTTTLVHATPITRSQNNIVEISVANGSFTTLVAAVKAADLVGTLTSPGPFTVFAPTDAAFAKLPKGTIEFLLANVGELSKVLTYHVLATEKTPSQLVKDFSSQTVQGSEVRARLNNSLQLVINNSLVVLKPIYASNGVIYVIDTVLIP